MKTIDQGITRRAFIKNTSLTSAALTLGLSFPASGAEPEVVAAAEAKAFDLNAWISIDTNGLITLTKVLRC